MLNINDKTSVLIEALPYIQRYENKIFVVKYGGAAMVNDVLKESFSKDIALLRKIGIHPIVVHGGGHEITRIAETLGIKTKFVNGLRYTDKNMMNAVTMGLSAINKQISAHISKNTGNAIGISGGDGNLISAIVKDEKLGLVGNIVDINNQLITMLIKNNMIPVIAPIGVGKNGQFYNINADTTASSIAASLKAEKLVYLSDTPGVISNDKLIPTITRSISNRLIKEGKIFGGMLPKIASAFDAIEGGVNKVHFIDGKIEHSLLLEIFTKKGVGTQIIKS